MIAVKLFYIYVNIYFVHLQCIKGDLFGFRSGMRVKDWPTLRILAKQVITPVGLFLAQWD